MSVMVEIEGQKSYEIPWDEHEGTVFDVFQALKLSAQAYIAAVDGEIVPVDYPIKDRDVVVLIRIMSGG